MEPTESDSAAVPNGSTTSEHPQLGTTRCELFPPTAHHDHDHDPEPLDLNHAAQGGSLGEELQNKLDLNGGGEERVETVEKVSNFNDGGEKVLGLNDHSDEGGAGVEESGQGEGGYDADNRGWECNSWDENENVNEYVNGGEVSEYAFDCGDGGDGVEKKEEKSGGWSHQYPLRPEAEDCAFYMKTGACKFGLNCKFNHPLRRRNQAVREKAGEREEPEDRSGQTECKYYQRSGGCKFGKSCKYNHTRGKFPTAPSVELNFLGLPIRVGEKECPYYMRTGSCKFGVNCKFNHPDHTAAGGCDPPSGYANGGSISLQGVTQPSVPSWSSSRKLNETPPFVPMMLSPNQGVSPRSTDWNGYQAPVYLPERNMHPPSAYVMNNRAIETNVYMHHQNQTQVELFPERPGEPECSYFLKTGDCKFKSNCKFHHPKNQVARLPPCNLSDKGLPLRPGQIVCSHYSRYGICKFGPACKFDHPIDLQPSSMHGMDQQSYPNTTGLHGVDGSGGASDATVQQSV